MSYNFQESAVSEQECVLESDCICVCVCVYVTINAVRVRAKHPDSLLDRSHFLHVLCVLYVLCSVLLLVMIQNTAVFIMMIMTVFCEFYLILVNLFLCLNCIYIM